MWKHKRINFGFFTHRIRLLASKFRQIWRVWATRPCRERHECNIVDVINSDVNHNHKNVIKVISPFSVLNAAVLWLCTGFKDLVGWLLWQDIIIDKRKMDWSKTFCHVREDIPLWAFVCVIVVGIRKALLKNRKNLLSNELLQKGFGS